MTITFRSFDLATDIDKVSQFLVDTYHDPSVAPAGHINWLQTRWEYMHFHPMITNVDRRKIGIWEDKGQIVGVAHPEHSGSPCYFEVRPGYESLKAEMLKYYEEHIRVTPEGSENHEGIFVMGGDSEFAQIATDAGYSVSNDAEPMSAVQLDAVPDSYPIPDGFTLQSLADDRDPAKAHSVLWRGFDHEGDPNENGHSEAEYANGAETRTVAGGSGVTVL